MFPATVLGRYRVGTLLRGWSVEDPVPNYLPARQYAVDFDPDGWEWRSAAAVLDQYGDRLPWLDGAPPDLQHIAFRLQDGGSLIVPCVEFYSRYYGRSEELRRVLLTYSWPEAERRLFGDPLAPHATREGVWRITVGPKMVDDDAVFLAHILYDGHAQSCAKGLGATRTVAGHARMPLRAGPWFRGRGRLLARAYAVAPNTYYCVRIDGGTEPRGPVIEIVKETSPGDGRTGDSGTEAVGPSARKLTRLPDELRIHRDRSPDSGVGYGLASNPGFVNLGARREVRVRRTAGTGPRRRVGSAKGADPEEFSTSEPASTGERIASLRIETPVVLESHGMLRDMWDALLFVKREYAASVTSVEWYTPNTGFRADRTPELIPLPAIDPEASGGAAWRWRLYNPDVDVESTRPRGVLVVRVGVDDRWVCICEIERRPMGDDEERFSGLIFPLDASDDLGALLGPVLAGLPAARGVFRQILGSCPMGAVAFRHSYALRQRVACEAAVGNALAKVGVRLVRRSAADDQGTS